MENTRCSARAPSALLASSTSFGRFCKPPRMTKKPRFALAVWLLQQALLLQGALTPSACSIRSKLPGSAGNLRMRVVVQTGSLASGPRNRLGL